MLGVFVPFEEGELCDPQEVELSFRDQIQFLCSFQTECAQNRECYLIFIGNNEYHVTLFAAQVCQDFIQLAVRQELCERAVRLFIMPADKCQTLCTDALCLFGELVNFFSGEDRSGVFRHDCPNAATCFQSRAEYHEVNILYNGRQILNLHAKPSIRLVGAIAFHGLLIGHAGEWCLDFHTQHLLEQILDKAFCHLEDILYIHKGHFQVDLCEFRLTVCPEVFIPEAACNLDIPIHAGNHQQLLVDLR